MEKTTTTATASANRVLLIAGVLIGAVVVATSLLVIVRQPPTYPAGSPEAVVQAYARAMLDGDEHAAAALLDPDEGCDSADLADADVADDVRVTLRSVAVDDMTAEIEIGVTVTSGRGPFESYEYDERHRFELTKTGDRWLITRRPWPWASCWR